MTSRIIQFFARRSFDTIRGVDTLIWALIWINVVGLGRFAGILANAFLGLEIPGVALNPDACLESLFALGTAGTIRRVIR